ncbi:T-cell leukemia/lymphoma protein 1A [Myotis brandtii]|uniref:T-cell leukemia/lymphoma protein 1A n=1 Tax=Myotis brandtii TaxID=109478 RepID=S7PEU4_MYOBR|nr:T-cell leukemia/lymphoma protein 1A [Myotis brandtii]
MAELPSNVPLTSDPIYLSICGPSVYEDENQHTWVHIVMDTGGDLQVQLRQGDYPIGHNGITTSLLTSSTMSSMWRLHLGSQYLDSMGQYWRIVHHVKEDEMEEMILELMDDS